MKGRGVILLAVAMTTLALTYDDDPGSHVQRKGLRYI